MDNKQFQRSEHYESLSPEEKFRCIKNENEVWDLLKNIPAQHTEKVIRFLINEVTCRDIVIQKVLNQSLELRAALIEIANKLENK